VLLLAWGFGLRGWWLLLPLSVLFGAVVFCVVEEWVEIELPEPEPTPRKSKSPPKKPRKPRRAKGKVIDFAAERARRAGIEGNG
jgi:hypothetical protein